MHVAAEQVQQLSAMGVHRYNHNLEADRPIDINFIGYDQGSVTVVSNGDGKVLLAFGATVPRLVEHVDAGGAGDVERVAAELASDAACVLFYRSLDCDLVGSDDCRTETEGRAPLEERVLENLPYSEIYEYGAHRA
ncbi:hypothetical protein B4Q13_15445, partial [Lacticaseibacillus rhamnosus]